MKKILILLLALLLLAGCGQKSDDTPAGGDTAVATSATIQILMLIQWILLSPLMEQASLRLHYVCQV